MSRLDLMFPFPFLTLLLLGAQACASGAPTTRSDRGPDRTVIHTEIGTVVVESSPHEEVRWEPVAAPVARVFRALPDVYEVLEIPVETLDPDRLLVGNGDHRVFGSMGGVRVRRLFDCGRAGGLGEDLASSETLRISLVTQVRSSGPGSAQVRTEAVARVRGGGVTSVHRSDCASTGLLEAVIADLTRHLAESGWRDGVRGGVGTARDGPALPPVQVEVVRPQLLQTLP